MSRFYSLAFRFMIRRPAKTLGSILGIALGVAVIVATVSAGQAARAQLNRSFTSMLGSADLVISHGRAFDAELAEAALKGLPVADQARQLFYGAEVTVKDARGARKIDPVPASVFGLDPKEARRFWTVKLAAGRFDFSGNNVVLSQTLARRLNRGVGDKLDLLIGAGPVRKRVAGVLAEVGLGNQGLPAVYMDLETARLDQGLENKISFLFLKLRSGASRFAVRKTLSQRLGPDIKVGRTPAGSAYALQMINVFGQILIAIGLFALIVGTLLIYQSTSAATAKMIPTLALIKALGATERQLIRVFLLESAVIGCLASIAGGAIGFFLAKVITVLLSSMYAGAGRQIPPSPPLFLAAFLLGVGVSVIAACLPVLRSARVPVVEAWRRPVQTGPSGSGPLLAWLARLLEPIVERIKPSAVVTQKNFTNNFRRLRFTAVCLIASLAMVIGVQMGVVAFQETANGYFAIYRRQSYLVRAVKLPGGDTTKRMPLATAGLLKRIAGAQEVIPYYFGGSAHFRGHATTIQSSAARETADWIYIKGSPTAAAARFRSGGWAAISSSFSNRYGVGVGESIDIEAAGRRRRFRVAAVIVGIRESVTLSWPDLRKYFNITEADEFEVLPAKNVGYKELGARLERFTRQKDYFLVTSKQFKEQMDAMLYGFAAMLLAITGSVLILTALGLANMMTIGALERRRVLGILRGQGMTRRQLIALLVGENIAVGLLALPAGLTLGYLFGSLFVRFIRDEIGISVTATGSLWIMPVSALLMLAILFATAFFPARRIASTPVAEALRYE